MPRCPYCKEDINSVIEMAREYKTYTVSLSRRSADFLEWEEVADVDHSEVLGYQCPQCHEELPLHDADDVHSFLKGELVLAMDGDIVRKGDYALYEGNIYRVENPSFKLITRRLRIVKDEFLESILKVAFQDLQC